MKAQVIIRMVDMCMFSPEPTLCHREVYQEFRRWEVLARQRPGNFSWIDEVGDYLWRIDPATVR